MTRVEKNAEELRRKDATMNDFKSKLDDLLDELERCCASQHFEVANDIRAKIHKLIKIIFHSGRNYQDHTRRSSNDTTIQTNRIRKQFP